MEITYLLNSGFMVKLNELLLIFDDYADPAGAVEKELKTAKSCYVFASHAHFDHFDTHILDYEKYVTRYIFSKDIARTKRGRLFPQEKTVFLPHYSQWEGEGLKVVSFSSTDVGASFLVEAEGRRIFHAGDFNWWHWEGDTQENILAAKRDFDKQLSKLAGLKADIAFFPVDGRLGDAESWGAKAFLAATHIGALVVMHRVGYPKWTPPPDFFPQDKVLPYWSPLEPGEKQAPGI